MKFNGTVWANKTFEGYTTGKEIIKNMESYMDNLTDYIANLEDEVERLEKENGKLSDTYCELQEKLDYIEKLEYLLDTNEINY